MKRIVLVTGGFDPLHSGHIAYFNKRMEWWWNVRVKNDGGLRLTDQAMDFIENQSKIKIYKIDFPKDFSITPQILLWLDKFIDSPYYITKRTISVLKEKAAFELYLFHR